MKISHLAAVAAVGLAGPASAITVTLESTGGDGFGNTVFTYQGTMTEDEGFRAGDKMIIYDFAGYIDGSIFTPSSDVMGSVEMTSDLPLLPGRVDDPTLANLVFTYVGAPFRNTGGPFGALDIDGFGASSIFSGTVLKDFSALTTKNNPFREQNSGVLTIGRVQTPLSAAIPEPATWAMMIGGFGLIGGAMRVRNGRPQGSTA